MTSASSFITSVIINFILSISCLLIFLYNRTRLKWIYSPRISNIQSFDPAEYHHPIPCTNTWFGWLDITIRMSTNELLSISGLDAVMYIKFFSCCFKIFIWMSIWMCILIPINITAYMDTDNVYNSNVVHHNNVSNTLNSTYSPLQSAKSEFNDFDILSMSVIPIKSSRMYAHLLAMYSLTYIVLYYMNAMWSDYLQLRHKWLQSEQRHGRHLTLMVTDIPNHIHSDEFQKLYQDAYTLDNNTTTVHCAWLLRNTSGLSNILQRRNKVVQQLESDLIKYRSSGIRPSTRIGICSTVDSIDINTNHLAALNNRIDTMQQQFTHSNNTREYNTGFVHFTRSLPCYTARHIPLTQNPNEYTTQFAPEPSDLYHPALKYSSMIKYYRTILVNCIVVLSVLGWTVPVVFAQSFTNLHEISKQYPFIQPLIQYNRALTGVIEGFLPSLILVALQQVLPYLLYYLSVLQGIESHSYIQMSILKKYYYFILFNFFLILTFANSIFSILSDLIDQPKRIFILLGESIPQVSTFYISYILLRSLTLFPMQLSRIVPLCYLSIYKYFYTNTPRSRYELTRPPQIQYGVEYADHLLIFLIGIIYACVSPIILPFSALFFGLGYIVVKYQLIYVYISQWESGGQFWPIIYPRMLIGLLVAQFTLIGLFLLKNGWYQYILALPLPVITYWFYYSIQLKYNYKSQYLCVNECHQVDTHLDDKHNNNDNNISHCPRLQYTQPELSIEPHIEPNIDFDTDGYGTHYNELYQPDIPDKHEQIDIHVDHTDHSHAHTEHTPLLNGQNSPKYQ